MIDFDRSNTTILIVDHDDASLEHLANILKALQYKVKTAKDAEEALINLRTNKGLYDLIITEFHLKGMNGLDFQKHIQDQYQIPIIMMSKDNNQHLISKTLENGAAHFIVKPFCLEDFTNIWKYIFEAKNGKLLLENLFGRSEEQKTSSYDQPNGKKNSCKRKTTNEYQGGEECQVVKKSRVVWTPNLHNLFLRAINQIGLENAEPKKILEIMNVQNLTNTNVASHLQKHRIFLRKVAEKGKVEGLSNRALKSNFASDLPISVVNELKDTRTNKLRNQKIQSPTGDYNHVLNHFNQLLTHPGNQIPNVPQGLNMLDLNQVKLGNSQLQTSSGQNNIHDQNMFGSIFSNQATNSFYNGAFYNGPISNDSFNHNIHSENNWNLGFGSSSNILPQNITCDARNNNPFGIQMSNKTELDGIGTMNNEGFTVGAQNENMNSSSLVNENFGLVPREFGLGSISNVGGNSPSQIHEHVALNNKGNAFQNLHDMVMALADETDLQNEGFEHMDPTAAYLGTWAP